MEQGGGGQGALVHTIGHARSYGHKDGAARAEAQFYYPSGVAVEASGSMLVADQGNHCVRRVSADGKQVTTVAGVAGRAGHRDGAALGEAQFNRPIGVAVEASGSMLVVEY
eukprot:COSAG02_NODE_11222_length_1768_cov_1.152187_1_plen_110_part_10